VVPADIDETVVLAETPPDYVARLSREKAARVVERIGGDAVVIAADTTVDVDGQILEKPTDDADARRMLRLLSGRAHLVHTGVTVVGPGGDGAGEDRRRTIVVETAVTVVEVGDTEIDWYLSTGEHVGKAGAYGIQGAAGTFVERIDGSVTNVIGLPLAEAVAMLRSATAID